MPALAFFLVGVLLACLQAPLPFRRKTPCFATLATSGKMLLPAWKSLHRLRRGQAVFMKG